MDYQEYARRRLRQNERLAIMQLDMISRSMESATDDLARLLADYNPLKRNVGMHRYICKDIIKHAIKDAPPDTASIILRQSRDYRMSLERVAPTRKEEECVMPLSDEWQFVQIVLDSRCGMCLKDGAECNGCGVRKLLRRYVDEPDPGYASSCGYKGCELNDSAKINRQERL